MLNCGLISLLEIGHIFPLIVVDIHELSSLEVKGWSIGLATAFLDGESQTSKEVMGYVL